MFIGQLKQKSFHIFVAGFIGVFQKAQKRKKYEKLQKGTKSKTR